MLYGCQLGAIGDRGVRRSKQESTRQALIKRQTPVKRGHLDASTTGLRPLALQPTTQKKGPFVGTATALLRDTNP